MSGCRSGSITRSGGGNRGRADPDGRHTRAARHRDARGRGRSRRVPAAGPVLLRHQGRTDARRHAAAGGPVQRPGQRADPADQAGEGTPPSPRDVIAAILAEGLPADDERRTFIALYTAYFALSLTEPALAAAPLVRNSGAVIGVVAAQLRAAQAAGDMPTQLDPDIEALSLLAANELGWGTSVLGGQSSPGQAQAVIDYHLDRLFPASRLAARRAPRDGRRDPGHRLLA